MTDESFRQKARSAIVQYALLRWENAVILAGTILLTGLYPHPFAWWPWWGWPLLGLVGLGAIAYSSLTNAQSNARLLLQLYQDQFDLRRIHNADLRKRVVSALEYQRRIDAQVRSRRTDLVWDQPEELAGQLNSWISNVYQLALRLDAYRQDNLLSLQRTSVPQELAALQVRRQRADPAFQAELDQLLESKGRQLESLQALETRMQQAEIQIEQSLAALATVDSQLRLLEAKDVESGRSRRLQSDIKEQVSRLNDLVASINEVYNQV